MECASQAISIDTSSKSSYEQCRYFSLDLTPCIVTKSKKRKCRHREFEVCAPGKVILSGEFSCVWGHPVIVLPLPLNLSLCCRKKRGPPRLIIHAGELCGVLIGPELSEQSSTSNPEFKELLELFRSLAFDLDLSEKISKQAWTVHLKSQIPLRMGMGSSASLIVAISRAFLQMCGRSQSEANVFWPEMRLAENRFHKQSSGVDIYAVMTEKAQCLRIGKDRLEVCGESLTLAGKTLILVSSGVEKRTADSMALLRRQLAEDPGTANELERIGEITSKLEKLLRQGDVGGDFQDLILRNHDILARLSLSHPRLDIAVKVLGCFGLGAKLTGGGRGGFAIALTTTEKVESLRPEIEKALSAEGFKFFLFASF